MFTLIFSSLLQTTQSVSFNQSSSNPALPALQLAEKQLYNARQRNPRLNSLAWAHPSLAWALIKTKIFPAVWIKHPQSWATRQDCSTATGRCQFAAQVSTLGISPFSSNQKINSSHSTQANYFFLHGRGSQIPCDAQRESVIYEQSTSTTTLWMVLEMRPEADVAPNIAAVANSYHLMLSERLQWFRVQKERQSLWYLSSHAPVTAGNGEF